MEILTSLSNGEQRELRKRNRELLRLKILIPNPDEFVNYLARRQRRVNYLESIITFRLVWRLLNAKSNLLFARNCVNEKGGIFFPLAKVYQSNTRPSYKIISPTKTTNTKIARRIGKKKAKISIRMRIFSKFDKLRIVERICDNLT